MPIITIQAIEGVVLTSPEQKRDLLQKMTDTFISVVGEVARPYTYCLIQETPVMEWSIAGRPLPDLPFLYGPEYAKMHSTANDIMREFVASQSTDQPSTPSTPTNGSKAIEQNKLIMRRMIDEVWNQGNLATADELFAADHTSPSAPQLPPGSEGVKILVKMFREAMPDYHMNIDLLVADESQVVARFTQSGTHTGGDLLGMKASGRKATWTEIGVLKIKDSKIVQSWYEVDMLSMIQQLNGTKQ
jgi:predicted ester cyclase/phenylpyruvate tautomerase PptA (4-oxalocrotonate tautomerase family)